MTTSKVLVIGANGFLGSAIAKEFLSQSAEVWGTYHNSTQNIPPECHTVSIDELKTLPNDFDCVILAAGNYSVTPKELIQLNVELPQKLSNHFTKAKVIFISSVAVYGNHKDRMNETSSFNTPSFYGLAKLAGEAVVQTHEQFAILRLTYLYGPTMPKNSFLPAIIKKAKEEKKITLFGKGERLQDYLHVNDAARLCVAASHVKENGVFLGATGTSLSNTEVVKKMQQYMPELELTFSGEDTAPWFQFDPSASEKAAAWKSQESFDATLAEMMK
jgi:UDP-glucose 4-epimerase